MREDKEFIARDLAEPGKQLKITTADTHID
jgi:hypothetical protein